MPALSLIVGPRFESAKVMLKNHSLEMNSIQNNPQGFGLNATTTTRSSNEPNNDCAIEKCLQGRFPGFSILSKRGARLGRLVFGNKTESRFRGIISILYCSKPRKMQIIPLNLDSVLLFLHSSKLA